MSKVQNGAKNDRALDELCKWYEGRGVNRGADPKKTGSHAASIPEGTPAQQKYVSSGDFVDYYNNCRDYTPEPNVQFDTTVVLQKMEREGYEKNKKNEAQVHKSTYRDDMKERLLSEARESSREVGRTITLLQGGAEKKITKNPH